jgi:hypothetical protein
MPGRLEHSASRKHLSGSDTSRDREFEGVVVGVESVNAPQPWDNWTFAAVDTLGTYEGP